MNELDSAGEETAREETAATAGEETAATAGEETAATAGEETAATTSGELALKVLRQQADVFADRAARARNGSDVEDVHQARVATRRLRAALRVFDDVLPTELQGLRDELGWIAASLGAARDLDVLVARLQRVALELGVSERVVAYGAWLEERRQAALATYDEASRSERFEQLIERLRQLENLRPDQARNPPLEEDAPPRLKAAHKRLRKRAQGLNAHSPPSEFHKLRIRTKWFRYTTEFLAELYGKPAQRIIQRTVALQDLLGDHQDGIVAGNRIEEAVHTAAAEWPAETSLALGRIVQWETEHGAELRRSFRSTYQEVEDAWKRLRRAL